MYILGKACEKTVNLVIHDILLYLNNAMHYCVCLNKGNVYEEFIVLIATVKRSASAIFSYSYDASHCVTDGFGKMIFGSGTQLHVSSSEYAESNIFPLFFYCYQLSYIDI